MILPWIMKVKGASELQHFINPNSAMGLVKGGSLPLLRLALVTCFLLSPGAILKDSGFPLLPCPHSLSRNCFSHSLFILVFLYK